MFRVANLNMNWMSECVLHLNIFIIFLKNLSKCKQPKIKQLLNKRNKKKIIVKSLITQHIFNKCKKI